jgi:hypothetical protein
MLALDLKTLSIVGGLGYVALRQLRGRRLSLTRLWIMPLLIVGWALTQLDLPTVVAPAHWPALGGAAAIGLLAGALMGWVNRVESDPATGELLVAGSLLTLLAWFTLMAARFGAEYLLAQAVGADGPYASALLLVSVSVGLLARRLCWYTKYWLRQGQLA